MEKRFLIRFKANRRFWFFPSWKSVREQRRPINSIDCGRTALSMMYCVRCIRETGSRVDESGKRSSENYALRDFVWEIRFIVLYLLPYFFFFQSLTRNNECPMGRLSGIRLLLFISSFNFHYVLVMIVTLTPRSIVNYM